MKLSACEISHLHVRGHNVSLIIGDRALTADEANSMVREFAAVYGTDREPAYVSRDGWQAIAREAPVVDTSAAAEAERLAAELAEANKRADALAADLDKAKAALAAATSAESTSKAASDSAHAKTSAKGKA